MLGWGEGLTVPYSRDRQREQGREQGRGQGDGQRNTGNKLDGLKRELRRRGYMVDLMPEGMERRKLNQSSWSVQ